MNGYSGRYSKPFNMLHIPRIWFIAYESLVKKFPKPWKCFGMSFESLYNACAWYELCFNCFLGCLYKFLVFIFQLMGKLFWRLGRLVRLMVLKSMYSYSQIWTVCMIRSGRSYCFYNKLFVTISGYFQSIFVVRKVRTSLFLTLVKRNISFVRFFSVLMK